jgi:DMSO/TMAO reductase YedYZ molybdopterin-dependent catalytic subunit
LTVAHGAPLRLVAPAHYGYKSAKHLSRIEFWRDGKAVGRAQPELSAADKEGHRHCVAMLSTASFAPGSNGVGILYDQGYFRQSLDRSGWQHRINRLYQPHRRKR